MNASVKERVRKLELLSVGKVLVIGDGIENDLVGGVDDG